MVFLPLWIHDDGLVRVVTDVNELRANEDGNREKCDGAKVDDLLGVRERLSRCFSLESFASGDVEFPYF